LVSVISIGSILLQKTHTSSVRPVKLDAGTILFPHCKQRVTRSITTSHGSCSSMVLRIDGSKLVLHFAGLKKGYEVHPANARIRSYPQSLRLAFPTTLKCGMVFGCAKFIATSPPAHTGCIVAGWQQPH
jgi:hypothetical protein